MSVNLKREFLSLLEKDTEFRYAVAGYLGLSEILKKMDALIEEQHKLWENQNRLWENQNRLWEEVKALREGQNKLWEVIEKLIVYQKQILEEERGIRFENELFSEEQERIMNMLRRLFPPIEEEARDVISYRLEKELGIGIKLDKAFIGGEEINIYGVSGEVCVVGEATVRLGVSLVEELEEKIELIKKEKPELLKPKLIKVIYADYSVPRALELASNYNIWVLNWKGDLTPRKIIQ
jgi:hypothetical protein